MRKETSITGRDLIAAISLIHNEKKATNKRSFLPPFLPLKNLQDYEVVKDWNILLKWELLESERDKVEFFRTHCLIRNEILKKKEIRFRKKNNDKGFWNYLKKECFFDGPNFANFRYGAFDKTIGNRTFLLPHPINPVIEQNYSKDRDTPVIEVFNEVPHIELKDLIQRSNKIEQLRKKGKTNEVFEDSTSWGLVDLDKKLKMPVMYLRVDLLKYNKNKKGNFFKKIAKLAEGKIKELQLKLHDKRRLHFKQMEVALMIYDLKYYGFSNKDILFLLKRVNKNASRQFVSGKLKTAFRLIESSTTSNFPKFS